MILEADLEIRAQRICEEYVFEPSPRRRRVDPACPARSAPGSHRTTSRRARKSRSERLLEQGSNHGDHLPWIERLLDWYYDPMYDYQLERKNERVIFRGDMADTEAFLQSPGQ